MYHLKNKHNKEFQFAIKYFNFSLGKFYFYHKGTKSTKDFFYEKIKKTKILLWVLIALCGEIFFGSGLSRLVKKRERKSSQTKSG